MNTFKNLQQRFTDHGEVHFKLGARWFLWLGLLFFGGILCLLPALGLLLFAEGRNDWLLGGVMATMASYGLVLPLVQLCNPRIRRNHRMRVSRDGVEMAGIRIPWHVIDEISLVSEGYGRSTVYHTLLQLSAPEVAHDGSVGGQRLAAAVNREGKVQLATGRMNVWGETLQKFLTWAKLECTPNATTLRFERM